MGTPMNDPLDDLTVDAIDWQTPGRPCDEALNVLDAPVDHDETVDAALIVAAITSPAPSMTAPAERTPTPVETEPPWRPPVRAAATAPLDRAIGLFHLVAVVAALIIAAALAAQSMGWVSAGWPL